MVWSFSKIDLQHLTIAISNFGIRVAATFHAQTIWMRNVDTPDTVTTHKRVVREILYRSIRHAKMLAQRVIRNSSQITSYPRRVSPDQLSEGEREASIQMGVSDDIEGKLPALKIRQPLVRCPKMKHQGVEIGLVP